MSPSIILMDRYIIAPGIIYRYKTSSYNNIGACRRLLCMLNVPNCSVKQYIYILNY